MTSRGEERRLQSEAKRAHLRWLLDRRLDDIRAAKQDQWKFGYTAIGAQAAVSILLLAKPEEVSTLHRLLSTAVALGVAALWWSAHQSVAIDLKTARLSKDRSYRLLGPDSRMVTPEEQNEIARHHQAAPVPRAIAIAVFGASLLALIVAWSAGRDRLPSNEAAERRCLAIQRDMLSAQPRRADGPNLFQALGCRPQGEGSVYAAPAKR